MNLQVAMDPVREDQPKVVFAHMPAGAQPLINGPIPEAQLVKIARDIDVSLRQDGEEKVVYVYYITTDVQAVVEQMKEATARAELKREARLAALAKEMNERVASLEDKFVIMDADGLRTKAFIDRADREKVQAAYYSVIRELVNELQMYLAAPALGPWEPMRKIKARLAEIVDKEHYLLDHLNATRPGFARFVNKDTINKLLAATWTDSLFLFPEPHFSTRMLLNDLSYSIHTQPFRGDPTPAAAWEAITIFLATIGKTQATDAIGGIKSDYWVRDHLTNEMLLEMAELHDYDPATWTRPIEPWELDYDSESESEGDKDSWDKSNKSNKSNKSDKSDKVEITGEGGDDPCDHISDDDGEHPGGKKTPQFHGETSQIAGDQYV